jgi:hypothetical protein
MDGLKKDTVNNNSDEQGNNNPLPAPLESRPQNRGETNGEQKKKRPKDKVNCYRRIQSVSAITMALCTLAIAGITAVYTHFAGQQVKQMEGSVTEMKSQSVATKQAVYLAERNIKTTQEQFRLDQRAWINIENGSMRHPFDPSKIVRVDFTTKNSGKTPARHVKYVFRAWIKYSGQKIAKIEKPVNIEFIYGPGDVRIQSLYTDNPYSQEMINPLQTGSALLFF